MKRLTMTLCALLMSSAAHALSGSDAIPSHGIGTTPIDPKTAEQCGMSMNVPNLKSPYDETFSFGCSGTYKNGGIGSLGVVYNTRPGDTVSFDIRGIGIDQRIASGKSSLFRLGHGDSQPTLADGFSYPWSGCGPVVKTTITPLHGVNWHGWIAEDTFQTPRRGCIPGDRDFTSDYRCIHVMVGNDKMTAELDNVCLLRKREYDLYNGFSYDLFMDMLKTLRFKEG